MRTSWFPVPLLPYLLLLTSCSSPPKPPTVDPATRHPVNASVAIDLLECRHELHNARIAATESGRAADTTSATLASLTARLRAVSAIHDAVAMPPEGNHVFLVQFEFGSSRVEIPPHEGELLLAHARLAPLVLLRGRTDGTRENVAEARIARDRAEAVRDYLVSGGVAPLRIRTTYQPTGDPVAGNESPNGRRLNRRVEVEIYRALPTSVSAATPAS
ncbi:MAG: OmpA family protein [Paucibacter sp.]|nr:OmpA family protein [Roseateles sp.]